MTDQGMTAGPGQGMTAGPGQGMTAGPGQGMTAGPDQGMGAGPGQGAGMQAVHQLRAVTVGLDLLAADFAQRNRLHPTDLRALICLLDAGRAGIPATPGWLARQLGLNSGGTTALLDRLERLGHVTRTPDPGDRRRVLLTVSDQAAALGWSFFGPLITEVVTALRRFPPAEQAAIQHFLATVEGIVAAQRTGPAAAQRTGSGGGPERALAPP